MSSEADGSSRPQDIIVIKQLLQRLEEAAARDSSGAVESNSDLDVLRADEPAGSEPEPAVLGNIILPAQAKPEDVSFVQPQKRISLTAAASFAMGIAAAGLFVFVFDPAKKRSTPSPAVTVVMAPEPAPAPPREDASPTQAQVSAGQTSSGGPARQALAAPSTAEPTAELARDPKPDVPTPAPAPSEVVDKPLIQPPNPVPAMRGEPRIEQASAPSATPATAAVAPPEAVGTSPPAPAASAQTAAPSQAAAILAPASIELAAGEKRSTALRVSAAEAEASRLLVIIRRMPSWLTLTEGGAMGNGIWLVPASQLAAAQLQASADASGSEEIDVQLARADGNIVSEARVLVRTERRPVGDQQTIIAAPAPDEAMILRLQARGELLLDTGEIEAARTLLRTAAEAGSVVAALKLAETYDPAEMRRLGMAERVADPLQAVRWYAHAESLGSPVASARLAALGRK